MAKYDIVQIDESYVIRKRWKLLWLFARISYYNNYLMLDEWTSRVTEARTFHDKDQAISRAEDLSGISKRKQREFDRKFKEAATKCNVVWSADPVSSTTSKEDELTFQLGEALRNEQYDKVDLIMRQLKEYA